MPTRSLSSSIIVVLVVLFALVDSAPTNEDREPDRISSPIARVVPSVVLRADSPMEVVTVFENTSDKPIRYVPGGDGKSFFGLRYTLTKDGTEIQPNHFPPRVSFNEKAILELPPGGTITDRLSLRSRYGRLKPGRYAIDVYVTGAPKAYDLTQIRFRERILYIDIVSE